MGLIEKIAVDDATLARLAEDARMHGRTIEQEAAEALRLGTATLSREDFIRRADQIAGMTPSGVKQTDSTLLLREDRDR
jgi:antitoxin FitA